MPTRAKRKTAKELIKTYPGSHKRRQELILALCQGGVGCVSHYATQPEVYAKFILGVADRLLEGVDND